MTLELFGSDLLNTQFLKYGVICLCLIAPTEAKPPFDGKTEALTGKTFCLNIAEYALL